jgi:hypothetical protein
MFIIAEVFIDDDVGETAFACDLSECKGACCCIEGGRGAPLEDSEVPEVVAAYPVVKQYLDHTSIRVIESQGLVEGVPGDFATSCVDHKQCVFVYLEKGIAQCSLERAYLEGKTNWRKPLSCHLFPLRVRGSHRDHLQYEVIEECAGGRRQGERHGITLRSFLKEPLTRKYGEEWYDTFDRCCTEKTLDNVTTSYPGT